MKLANVIDNSESYAFEDINVAMPAGNYYGVILSNTQPFRPAGGDPVVMGRIGCVPDTGGDAPTFDDNTDVTIYAVASRTLHGGLGIPMAEDQQTAMNTRRVFHFRMDYIPQTPTVEEPRPKPRKSITLIQ
jgi:hypothetical protein